MNYVELGGCCGDCLIAIANDDYSGMSDEQEARTKAGIKRIGHYLVPGEEIGFTHSGCAVCLDGLAGTKHQVGYLIEKKEASK
jgi:hypothetical protein